MKDETLKRGILLRNAIEIQENKIRTLNSISRALGAEKQLRLFEPYSTEAINVNNSDSVAVLKLLSVLFDCRLFELKSEFEAL